jgi:hypothetical protein
MIFQRLLRFAVAIIRFINTICGIPIELVWPVCDSLSMEDNAFINAIYAFADFNERRT